MYASILRCLGALAITMVVSPRSVDAAAPAGHYVVTPGSGTGNGTVYDSKSKLTWQQTASGPKTVSWTAYTWAEAKTYCAGVGASLGGTGWRLPTIKELLSILDPSQTALDPSQPAVSMVDPNAFPSDSMYTFWSSSPLADSSSYAWTVSFDSGFTDYSSVTDTGFVRCVR